MSAIDLANRALVLRKGGDEGECVCYWMSREQRCEDNQALTFASEIADRLGLPVLVFFALAPKFIGAARRHYDFMLDGLTEVERELTGKGMGFRLLVGEPEKTVPDLISEVNPAALVTDFDPLRAKQAWKERAIREIDVTVYEVDAHNIVPCRFASNKREWGAATLRRKINALFPSYLRRPPPIKMPKATWKEAQPVDWKKARSSVQAEDLGDLITWIEPGGKAAKKRLKAFLTHGLSGYPERRNDPTREGQSDLSPYLHFGQISALRVAWEVTRSEAPETSKKAFLEELVVRRELSDNFCLHVPDYDSVSGFPEWSKVTLDQHRYDERDYIYTAREFEEARTHDRLWNAAQREMVSRGKMHGYMRMYWAKKILEWSETPEEAMRTAIMLNDRYELDGRDPNGYTGIAWSIGGVHDRAWPSRKVFGKVRFMSYGGAKSKFDVESYIERWS
ncbi:MAG: deoxyribodipyrimidine photo-lyase [Methanomassiliicoccales archaeon]|nr:deoxyribodipyrimidine photo-lyase [Methanomassiliicoccales archaeon]